MTDPVTNSATETKSGGKGFFVPSPLEFTLDDKTYTYAGRGRWSVQLATLVVTDKKAPEKQKDGTWGWRDATAEELGAAQKLVDKIASKLKAKADAAALRVAARAAKKVSAPKAVKPKAVKTETAAPAAV